MKACHIVEGYTQTYGLDYAKTYSPVAKIASVWVLISLTLTFHWPLYQLNVKNAFLHGEVYEEVVYMEQPSGFVAQGENGKLCS